MAKRKQVKGQRRRPGMLYTSARGHEFPAFLTADMLDWSDESSRGDALDHLKFTRAGSPHGYILWIDSPDPAYQTSRPPTRFWIERYPRALARGQRGWREIIDERRAQRQGQLIVVSSDPVEIAQAVSMLWADAR